MKAEEHFRNAITTDPKNILNRPPISKLGVVREISILALPIEPKFIYINKKISEFFENN